MFTLNCKGRLLTIDSPVVMGIVNVTPDSFYAGSRKPLLHAAFSEAEQLVEEGAAFLDVGGQSTHPGSEPISETEEAARILPVIEQIISRYPESFISVDTFYASVARQAVDAGASMVNDISGGNFDKAMLETIAKLSVPFVCMHIQGKPKTMQLNPSYQNIVREITDYFIQQTEKCRLAGIHDIIIDPGFGFGKTIAHNFELLQHLSVFKIFDKPIMAGLSRKSTVYKTLGITPEEALNGTTVLNTIALLNGATILRVHDVKQAMEAIKLVNAYRRNDF